MTSASVANVASRTRTAKNPGLRQRLGAWYAEHALELAQSSAAVASSWGHSVWIEPDGQADAPAEK